MWDRRIKFGHEKARLGAFLNTFNHARVRGPFFKEEVGVILRGHEKLSKIVVFRKLVYTVRSPFCDGISVPTMQCNTNKYACEKYKNE